MNFRSLIQTLLFWIERTLGDIVLQRILERLMTRDNILAIISGILDFVGQYTKRTETTLDDRFLRALRDALDIPDTEHITEPNPPPES